MSARYWVVCMGDGGELCSGVSDDEIERVAQRHADRLGETVYASVVDGRDHDGDDEDGSDEQDVPYEPS